MKYLYLWLDLGSFIVPFVFSFHPRLCFYKKWKYLFPAIAVMMAVFIPWDIWFTAAGHWGFNERYLSGYAMFGLPIEEWLFFVCIPYACIFTHYALTTLFPNFRVSEKTAVALHVLLVSLLVVTLWYNYDRWYTLVNFCCAVLVMAVVYNYKKEWLQPFWATYAVLLVPFFIVNGVLTGTGIAEQVVWYNNNENLGIRLLTVPIEDMIYNLGMLLTVYAVMERLHERDTAKG